MDTRRRPPQQKSNNDIEEDDEETDDDELYSDDEIVPQSRNFAPQPKEVTANVGSSVDRIDRSPGPKLWSNLYEDDEGEGHDADTDFPEANPSKMLKPATAKPKRIVQKEDINAPQVLTVTPPTPMSREIPSLVVEEYQDKYSYNLSQNVDSGSNKVQNIPAKRTYSAGYVGYRGSKSRSSEPSPPETAGTSISSVNGTWGEVAVASKFLRIKKDTHGVLPVQSNGKPPITSGTVAPEVKKSRRSKPPPGYERRSGYNGDTLIIEPSAVEILIDRHNESELQGKFKRKVAFILGAISIVVGVMMVSSALVFSSQKYYGAGVAVGIISGLILTGTAGICCAVGVFVFNEKVVYAVTGCGVLSFVAAFCVILVNFGEMYDIFGVYSNPVPDHNNANQHGARGVSLFAGFAGVIVSVCIVVFSCIALNCWEEPEIVTAAREGRLQFKDGRKPRLNSSNSPWSSKFGERRKSARPSYHPTNRLSVSSNSSMRDSLNSSQERRQMPGLKRAYLNVITSNSGPNLFHQHR